MTNREKQIFLSSNQEEEEELCPWNEFHVYLDEKGKEIVSIPADGLCFFRGVQNNLGVQYNKKYSIDEIEEIILIEIGKRPKFYLGFYPEAENKKRLLEIVKEFFITKSFASTTVDLLIGATCNAFDFTLCVYQENEKDLMQCIEYSTGQESQKQRCCNFILYRDRNDVQGTGSHYSSIISKMKNNGREYEDYGVQDINQQVPDQSTHNETIEEENYIDDFNFEEDGPPNPGLIITPTPSPDNTLDDFNPTYIQPEYTTENTFDDPQAAIYNSRGEGERICFPYMAASDLTTENISQVPYNINGNHHYKIPVSGTNWHKLQEDERWFFMRSSTMRHTNKVKKIGKCLGSYTCRNDTCPKYTSGKGRNTYAFTCIGLNFQECKTCGSVAKREFCGALKSTTFDPETHKLEVTYVGHHTCSLKSRVSYTMIASPVKRSILKPILQKNPNATAKHIAEEAAENFLRMGKPGMAKESVKLSQDRRLVSSIKEEILKVVSKKDPNSFHAIAYLRDDLKTIDPYLIFKINDGTLNDEISYVYKSSKCAAQLALEMDCEDIGS